MLRTSTISILILTAIITAKAGIDLTPLATEYIAEGIKYQQLTFRQDKQAIEYELPWGWSFHGSANQFYLNPPKRNFAEAVIESVPLAAPRPLDEKVSKALEQQFIDSLPVGSQFVTVVSEGQNTILLDRHPSFEVTVSYQLIGEKFLRSAIFVNLPDTQLMFRFTARKDDFAALYQTFRSSILSWHWVEPGPSHDQNVASAPAQQISQSH
jgi:hypothetical protein